MADVSYKTFPARFVSRGISARSADDTLPEGSYLNLDNLEELTENTLASRLGSVILNRTGVYVDALGAPVQSLAKLTGLKGSVWRYAGAGGNLYRRTGLLQGAYTAIASGLSGKKWSSGIYRPNLSSYPYLFLADAARMLKDNGSLASPQQWGIFAPNQPVIAQIQAPAVQVIDSFDAPASTYTKTNFTGGTTGARVATTLTQAVTAAATQTVTVANAAAIAVNALLSINLGGADAEVVLVTAVTSTGFRAFFAHAHASGEAVTANCLSGSVAASTTATVRRAANLNLATFGGSLASAANDFLSFSLKVSDPNNIEQIRLYLDVGDGSFTQDYFYAVIAPNVAQSSVSETTGATQALAQAVFGNTLAATVLESALDTESTDVSPLSPYTLNTGLGAWSPIAVRLGDFNTVGQADINSLTGRSFANVVAFQVQIVTNTTGSVQVGIDDLTLVGGYGPDSFGGVSYDWLYTYYNAVTGAESNPCMSMADVDPPNNTTFLLPRRSPIKLTLTPSIDPQVTHIRVYRRGGTLASNYLRLDQVPANTVTYLDQVADADIESADTISFTNDVPVTSTLPVPVSTYLMSSLTPPFGGKVLTVSPGTMTSISVNQQVTIGSDVDPNQEIVIVMSVGQTSFTAFVQNPHAVGDPVAAEAVYGQPCNLMAVAYNAVYLAGDPNNPHYLYYSSNFSPESFGSPNFVEVGTPGDPITAIIPFQGALYVATRDRWYVIGPQKGAAPTVYPTSAAHGVYAPFGWAVTESEIWHRAVDGLRTFSGAASSYRSQEIEFVFQGGSTPVAVADPAFAQNDVMAYHNNAIYHGYQGLDGTFHRVIYHTLYKRFRNDDIPAMSLLHEEDTNTLVYGDAAGLVHQDRAGAYDEGVDANGILATTPVAISLQSAYMDEGAPKNQKNYNELTLDADTAGQPLTVALLFNDGQITVPIGTLNTTGRQKQNFIVLGGLGQQAYRASLRVTGPVTQRVTLFQADLRGVEMAETRRSFDTYLLKFGVDDSKICKQVYLEYSATATITFNVLYDNSATPGFTFTLDPAARRSTRVRLPAIKFRMLRMVGTSSADFQVWPDSRFEVKPVCATKGYASFDMMP